MISAVIKVKVYNKHRENGWGLVMESVVRSFIERHKLLTKETTVLIGVSGGPDSMALLHFLSSIQSEWRLRLIALSVDHGLRGEESRKDMSYVEEMCRLWNIEFCGTSVDVPLFKQKENVGTQVAARELRYQFFQEQMEAFSADYLVLGHHGDDQAETMLMRFVNRSNPAALSGIPVKRPFHHGFVVRPFLCITKSIIESYCQKNDILPRRDPSNRDVVYTRNYFRMHILPLLKKQNPNLHRTMQKLSETFYDDETYLRNEAGKLVDSTVNIDLKSKQAQFVIEEFRAHPPALQRRAFHLILSYLYINIPKDLFYVHEEQFFGLLVNQKANAVVDFPLGLKMTKAYTKIIFYFADPEVAPYHATLEVPGSTYLPDGSRITASETNSQQKNTKDVFTCDRRNVRLPLQIRTREPGDKMTVPGLKGRKKVKDIFIDEKIPLYERDAWPIVTDGEGKVLWVVGLKKTNSGIRGKDNDFIQIQYQKQGNM